MKLPVVGRRAPATPSTRSNRVVPVAILAIVALASGCGGDEKGGDETSPTTTEASVGTTAPTFSGQADSRYCELSRELRKSLSEPNAAVLRQFYADLDTFSVELLKEAPSVIKADIETFLEGFRAMQSALEKVDYDFEQLDTSKVPALNSPEFPTAGNRMIEFDRQVCEPTAETPESESPAPPSTQPETTVEGDSS